MVPMVIELGLVIALLAFVIKNTADIHEIKGALRQMNGNSRSGRR